MGDALQKLIEIVCQNGPFPAGIIVGILINAWANRMAIKYLQKENESLRQHEKVNHDILESQSKRIDELHKKLPPPKK